MTKPPTKLPTQIGSSINTGQVPTTFKRGEVISKEGLAKAGKQMLADQQRGRNLAWLRKANGGLVSFLLDKSGSMALVKSLVIQGFNEYVGALRKYRGVGFSFYQFDSASFDTIYEARPVEYVTMLTDDGYHPLGGTPLYDSVIETTLRMDKMVSEGQIPANRVIIAVMTDGGDTSFKDATECRNLIAARQRRGYQYQFLGAGIDGYQLATMMGIAPESVISFDSEKVGDALKMAGNRQTEYLAGRAADATFKPDDRKRIGDKHAPKLLT